MRGGLCFLSIATRHTFLAEFVRCCPRRLFPIDEETSPTARDVTATVKSVFKSSHSFSDGMAAAISEILDDYQKFDFNSREELDEALGKALTRLSQEQ